MQTDSKWTQEERFAAAKIVARMNDRIVSDDWVIVQAQAYLDEPVRFTELNISIDLQCKISSLTEALEDIDRLAEAGLCQMSSGGKHAYLSDIRSAVLVLGVQGGLTPHGS